MFVIIALVTYLFLVSCLHGRKTALLHIDNMNSYLLLGVRQGFSEEFKCGSGTGTCANLSSGQSCEAGTQLKHL